MDELEITPAEVKARLDRGENVVLVDVREPWEFEICRIQGAKLVPLGALAGGHQEAQRQRNHRQHGDNHVNFGERRRDRAGGRAGRAPGNPPHGPRGSCKRCIFIFRLLTPDS